MRTPRRPARGRPRPPVPDHSPTLTILREGRLATLDAGALLRHLEGRDGEGRPRR